MSEPKLCINCKWHCTGHVCTHSVSENDKGPPARNWVTGAEASMFDRFRACGTMRMYEMCGSEGKLFEAKASPLPDASSAPA